MGSSQVAYSAFYFLCIDIANTVSLNLVCAKSKVTPIELMTLLRLELSGFNPCKTAK